MTAPHIGNTGVNDEDQESSRIWVAGYVVRDPARVPSQLAVAAQPRRRAAGAGRGRHLRHRHPGADPAPARARCDAGRDLLDRDRPGRAARAGPRGRPRWPAPSSPSEVSTGETYVVPAIGEKRLTVAALDLGIKAMTPHRMAERGIEVHVLPGHRDRRRRARRSAPDGLFYSNGPGDPAATTSQVELLQGALAEGIPYFGICFGNQLFGRALGFGTYKLKYGHRGINQPVMDRTTGKVEVTAHNHGFAVDAPLDAPTETPYGVATVSHVCLNDDVVEGLELRDADGKLKALLRPVPPRGGRRTARRGVPLRPVRPADGRHRLMPKRDDIKSRAGDRLRADHHRPGLRVRLLRHPGLPGAHGRGHPGGPGQLQPGHDHDRPRVRGRDVHRADHRRSSSRR